MDSDRTYGVAILGFGFIGKVHAYGYRTMPMSGRRRIRSARRPLVMTPAVTGSRVRAPAV